MIHFTEVFLLTSALVSWGVITMLGFYVRHLDREIQSLRWDATHMRIGDVVEDRGGDHFRIVDIFEGGIIHLSGLRYGDVRRDINWSAITAIYRAVNIVRPVITPADRHSIGEKEPSK